MSLHGRARAYPSLRAWRKALRLSQRQAADHLGISQTFYSRLERRRQAPKPKLAGQIVERSGVPLESVLGIDV